MSETITLYTQQAQVVLDAIERDGYSRVKWEYIQSKYGDDSWAFRQAYAFFAQNAPTYVAPPEGAESGIWCYCDQRWAVAAAGGHLLKLEVPREKAVLFDSRIWNKMLNLQYVGKDEADEEAFESKLASMGIKNAAEAFSTSFYPMAKREIQQSWQRLFGSADQCPETYVMAGLWELRREWLVDTMGL